MGEGSGFDGRRRAAERLGAVYRTQHSVWLTKALGGGFGALPSIPRRRVADGGFASLMATPAGRQWAASWWGDAFEGLDRSK